MTSLIDSGELTLHNNSIAPKRLASLVDIFACAFLTLMSRDGGPLIVTELAGCTPLKLLPHSFYMFARIIFTYDTIHFGLLCTPEEKAAAAELQPTATKAFNTPHTSILS